MNTKHISLAFAAVSALLAGCAKSPIEEPCDGQPADLELSYVGATETKAAIDGTTFPTDGEIGLFLFKDEAATAPYGESGCENIEYSYNSTKSKWTASPSIKVGSTPGYLCGYYPYSSTATNVKAIPVSSSLNGDDVMYATPVTGITDKTASQTAIVMNHALARVSVKVINNGYTGDAKLSKIKFSGAETAVTGTLDATNGDITATTADVALDVPADSQAITAEGTVYECLLVPSGIDPGKQELSLTLTIDGQDKTVTLSGDNGVIILQNTKSNITISLSNSGISVQTVSVEDWNVVEVGGYKVTLKFSDDAGIADNLIVQCKPDGNSVKVEAASKTLSPLVIRIGDDTRIAPVEDGNISTFTISDITSDITATLAYAKTFKVTGKNLVDVPPVDGYFNFEGLGDVLEGRTRTVKVGMTYGYHTKMVCEDKTVTGSTIVFEDVSKDIEVSAYHEFCDILPGVFTVSADGRQVKFARGNMWYQNGVLHNEDEQYQFSRSDWAEDGHISHFMWSKSLAESVKKIYEDAGASEEDNFFTNAVIDDQLSPNPDLIVNGQKGIWRVLSGGDNGEWDYLLNTRKTTFGYRYAEVDVNGMHGLLIFPDEFTWPSGAGDQPVTFNAASDNWNGVDYKGDAFEALQDAGCVFLPAAGRRAAVTGIPNPEKVYDVGGGGYYWSASPYNVSCDAYVLEFYDYAVKPSEYNYRNNAFSVRLVTEVTEETE